MWNECAAFSFAVSVRADTDSLPQAARDVVAFMAMRISESSWAAVAVAAAVLLGLSALQPGQQLPGERVVTFCSFVLTFSHAGCLLLLGQSAPEIPVQWMASTSCLLGAEGRDEQLVAAASCLADADAQTWGRLRRVLFWVLVCI